jgi:hypothetical protein
MKTMAYEGGWSVGGDFDQKPIHAYCKYIDPQTIDADAKAINVYTSGGGALFCYYYSQWPDDDIDNAVHYPLVQAVIKRNDFLPTEPNYGALVPGNLTPANSTLISGSNADRTGALSAQGAWMDWNIIAPVTQTYHLVPTLSGTGGSSILLVDDTTVVPAGSADSDTTGVKLTKGQHTVKIRNTGSTPLSVQNIAVTMKGAPAAPNLTSADFGDGKCTLTWTAVPTATGYTVYYGTTSGNYTTSVKAGNVTSFTLPGLDNSVVYYFAVQASGANGLLGLCSNEQRVAHRSSDPQVLIDFEDQPVHTGPPDSKPNSLTLQNYLFTAFGNVGALAVQGPESHWPSKVLSTCYWGNCHRIQRADFKPFDLYSLDLCSIHGQASAIITGYDPSGAAFKKIVNFNNTPDGQPFVIPVVLDWANVVKVEIRWGDKRDGGDTQGREGAIDNVLFNKHASTAN